MAQHSVLLWSNLRFLLLGSFLTFLIVQQYHEHTSGGQQHTNDVLASLYEQPNAQGKGTGGVKVQANANGVATLCTPQPCTPSSSIPTPPPPALHTTPSGALTLCHAALQHSLTLIKQATTQCVADANVVATNVAVEAARLQAQAQAAQAAAPPPAVIPFENTEQVTRLKARIAELETALHNADKCPVCTPAQLSMNAMAMSPSNQPLNPNENPLMHPASTVSIAPAPHSKFTPIQLVKQGTCDYLTGAHWRPRLVSERPLRDWESKRPDEEFTYGRWGGNGENPAAFNQYFMPPIVSLQQQQCPYEPFDAQRFFKKFKGKTIAFYGDSLIRQLFGQLLVMLRPYEIAYTLYKPPKAQKHNPNRVYYYPEGVVIKNQWVTGHGTPHALSSAIFPTMLESDLLVVNVGAFHEHPNSLNEVVKNFLEWTKRNYRGTVLWREYSAAHFSTPNGEFIQNKNDPSFRSQYTCLSTLPLQLTDQDNNWRRTIPNQLCKQYGITVMPVWEMSKDRVELHPAEASDCRHWFFPSYLLEHWVELLYNIVV